RRERPLPVRIGKRGFGARIKGDLRVEFGQERLTVAGHLDPRKSDLRVVAENGAGAKSRDSRRAGVNGSSGQKDEDPGLPPWALGQADESLTSRTIEL
ncbi:MAG TPA: hypothetical protein VN894_03390, partial [Polyangiaceae bacterium]|nr:hypothetical protein [Polyangiaceae bacterium]